MSIATRIAKVRQDKEPDRIVEWCSIDDMFVDTGFQRPLKKHFVKRIVDKYDASLIGMVVVNLRDDGGLSVIDGQHRYEALKQLGHSRALCEVMQVALSEEARIFVALQRNRMPMKKLDQHKALVFQGDPQALEIQDIVHEAGYKMTDNSQNNSLACAAAIYEVHKKYGADTLREALVLIRAAWGGEDRTGVRSEMVRGVAILVSTYRGDLKMRDLVTKMSVVPTGKLFRAAAERSHLMGGDSGTMVARQLAEEYNRGKRSGNRLDVDRLGRP